jgi:hypothetical protein
MRLAGARKTHDGRDPRRTIARVDTAGAKLISEDVHTLADDIWRDCAAHNEVSLGEEVVDRLRHLSDVPRAWPPPSAPIGAGG